MGNADDAAEQPVVWVDTETTGLDPIGGHLLEVAAISTDSQLNELGRWHRLILPAPYDDVVAAMSDDIRGMHSDSGLLQRLADMHQNGGCDDLEDVDAEFAAWVARQATPRLAPRLAGNSITFDRQWLEVHMPASAAAFHYRSVDESSVSWVFETSAPQWAGAAPEKRKNHRAIDDIEDSIARMRHWKHLVAAGAAALAARGEPGGYPAA